MGRAHELLRGLFRRLFRGGEHALTAEDAEQLSTLFKDRYHSFRQLLAANSKALTLMAEMEHARAGVRPFGMPFVRSRSTAMGVSVYRMVRHLNALAPGKYGELFDRLEKIQEQMRTVVGAIARRPVGRLVTGLAEIHQIHVDDVGSKMANLGEARTALGAVVPEGFVISTAAFDLLLEHNDIEAEIERQIQATEVERTDELFALSSRLQQLIIAAEVPEELA